MVSEMNQYEINDMLDQIDYLGRLRDRLLSRARDPSEPQRLACYEWADEAGDQISKLENELWIANGATVHDAKARGELPL